MKKQESLYFFIVQNKISVPHSPNLVVLRFVLHSSGYCWIYMVQGRHCETLRVCSGPSEGPCRQRSAISRRCGRPARSGRQVYCTVGLATILSYQTSGTQLPGIRQFAFVINLQMLFLLIEFSLMSLKVWGF